MRQVGLERRSPFCSGFHKYKRCTLVVPSVEGAKTPVAGMARSGLCKRRDPMYRTQPRNAESLERMGAIKKKLNEGQLYLRKRKPEPLPSRPIQEVLLRRRARPTTIDKCKQKKRGASPFVCQNAMSCRRSVSVKSSSGNTTSAIS